MRAWLLICSVVDRFGTSLFVLRQWPVCARDVVGRSSALVPAKATKRDHFRCIQMIEPIWEFKYLFK